MNPALVATMPSTFDVATQFAQYLAATQRFQSAEKMNEESAGVFASAGLTGFLTHILHSFG